MARLSYATSLRPRLIPVKRTENQPAHVGRNSPAFVEAMPPSLSGKPLNG
jgi:hypothetical protein